MIERQEFTCNQCGRTRLLSKEEAIDDGWFMHSEYGLSCPHCIEYYGIPMPKIIDEKEYIKKFGRSYLSHITIVNDIRR